MSADALLSRLEKPKATGRGSWLACCPAHDDKHPSLAVRELDDGRVLLHCFAGCAVDEVLAAVALDFEALFPPKPIEHATPVRRPFPAADVLEALAHESLVVQLTAAAMSRGEQLGTPQFDRLRVAMARIHEGRNLANG